MSDQIAGLGQCRCDHRPACQRPVAVEGYCNYCLRMYPCDHDRVRFNDGSPS